MRVTIGISPGTRYIGVAILRGGELVTWRMLSFRGSWSAAKHTQVVLALEKLFAAYTIKAVAVRVPNRIPKLVSYSQLLGAINVLCEHIGIRAVYYSTSDLKRCYIASKSVNKQALWSYIAHKFPELMPEFEKELHNRHNYYDRVFEAIAAGLCTGRTSKLPK